MSQALQGDSEEEESSESIAPTLISEVSAMSELVDSVIESDLQEMSDEELVSVHTELKKLEKTAEEVRKERAEEVLEDRVEPGEKLLGLSRIKSHNKYVKGDVGSVIMRAVSNGIDYTQFVDINASKLDDVAPEVAEIGRSEYTYFR